MLVPVPVRAQRVHVVPDLLRVQYRQVLTSVPVLAKDTYARPQNLAVLDSHWGVMPVAT